jgi:nitroimidazol reductase NimA-like FMN-containing flavoprotein (pyridoxamine 5'-phosphate oxidase superfamily)
MKLTDDHGLEVLSRDECLQRLREHNVGRLAVVAAGRPEIFPVNYVLDGEAVVFRTDEGTKLTAAERSMVAFGIDEIDPATRSGWSVVVHGRAEEMSTFDGPVRERSLRELGVDPWAGGEKRHWVRIEPLSITGRRVAP